MTNATGSTASTDPGTGIGIERVEVTYRLTPNETEEWLLTIADDERGHRTAWLRNGFGETCLEEAHEPEATGPTGDGHDESILRRMRHKVWRLYVAQG